MSTDKPRSVKAHYASPDGDKEFSIPMKATCPPDTTTEQKTAYLSELRANTKHLQENINTFLTQKMTEDKAKDGQAATPKKGKSKDEVEEDNYGEEAPEDDD